MNIITGTVAIAVIHLQPSVGMTISATTTIKVDPSAQKNWKQTKTLWVSNLYFKGENFFSLPGHYYVLQFPIFYFGDSDLFTSSGAAY